MRALGVKVKRVRMKRAGVVSSQYSDAVSRREDIVAVSIYERRLERSPSSRQRRRKVGLSVAITCTCRLETRRGYSRRESQSNGSVTEIFECEMINYRLKKVVVGLSM